MFSLRRARYRRVRGVLGRDGRYGGLHCARPEQGDFHERIGSLVCNAEAGEGSDIERFEPQR